VKFVKDPVEKTTAVTDIILALVAFGSIVFLERSAGRLVDGNGHLCQHHRSRNPGKQIGILNLHLAV